MDECCKRISSVRKRFYSWPCTIFEILNARGSALEGHELLKNFIMRGIKPDGNIDSAKVTWEEIERLLGNNSERFVKHYATHKYRTSTLAHKERRENKSSAKETIGTLIQNARKSNSENSEPDFQQLSLFWLLLAWSGYLHLSRKRHFVPSFFDFKILALCKPDWMFSEGKSY